MPDNIGNSLDPSSSYIQPPAGVQPEVEVKPDLSSVQSQSSISLSELEQLILLMAAGYPVLPQPQFDTSTEFALNGNAAFNINLKINDANSKIITSMWESFGEGIRKNAKIVQESDIKAQALHSDQLAQDESHKYFLKLVITSVAKSDPTNPHKNHGIEGQFNTMFAQWMSPSAIDPSSSQVSGIPNYPSSGFIAGAVAGSVAITGDLIQNSMGGVSNIFDIKLTTSPVADALTGVGPSSGLPADAQAAAAMVAALLYNGSIFKATYDTVQYALVNNKTPEDLKFAQNFAINVMTIITTNVEKNQSLPPERARQNNMVRLMLATIALNMLYRTVYGNMTGKEFKDLLTLDPNQDNSKTFGDIPKEAQDLFNALIAQIQKLIPTASIDPKATLADLMEYIESKDPVDSMLDTTRLFSSFLRNGSSIKDKFRSELGA